MIGVLSNVYRYFLQQATATARLAQDQLVFERQQMTPAIIQSDYWEPLDPDIQQPGHDARDRRGLTGSARLLQDVDRLDQYAFESDKRKLNLSQTFSLAQRAPFEFQLFRETGVLQFATPMQWFDEGFPGHYLRLIKRVRVSLAALIPPRRVCVPLSRRPVSRASSRAETCFGRS
jgi:Tc toxin complex TcA C-terminal TcB-binding domain